MKKIIFYLSIFISFFFIPYSSAFAETESPYAPKKSTISSDGVQYFKVVSGDGVYLFGGEPKPFDIDEFRKERKAQKTDYITEEQIEQGYILWDGWLYPPNDLDDGEISPYIRGEGDIDDSAYNGLVKFTMDVPPGTTSGVFIEVMDAVNYDTYHFEFFAGTHFAKDISMPRGTYLITDGGFLDTSVRSVASESYFRVIQGDITNVKVAIRDYEDIIKNGKDDIEDAVTDMDNEYVESLKREEYKEYGLDPDTMEKLDVADSINNIAENGIGSLIEKDSPSENSSTESQKSDHRLIFIIIFVILMLCFFGMLIYGLNIYRKNQAEDKD